VIPEAQQAQIADALEDDAEVMSNTQLAKIVAGEPPAVQEEITDINTDARHIALQVALLIPLLAALAGLGTAFLMLRLPEPNPSDAAEGLMLG
jgi:hypothetical protein